MDIDAPVHSLSWADQMDLVDPLLSIDQFDLNDALPTSEQIELEYAQCTPSSTTEHVDYAPSPPPFHNTQIDSMHTQAPFNDTQMDVTPLQPSLNDTQVDVNPSVIPYDINSPADPSLWNGQFQELSVFSTKETFVQDTTNVISSLERAATFINQRELKGTNPNSYPNHSELFHQFSNAAWRFLSAIYSSKWDQSFTDGNISFCNRVSAQLKGGNTKNPTMTTPANLSRVDSPKARVSKIPPPIPPRPTTSKYINAVKSSIQNNEAKKIKTVSHPK